jgi:hypothetical protein
MKKPVLIDVFGEANNASKEPKQTTPVKQVVKILGKNFDATLQSVAEKRIQLETLKSELALLESEVKEVLNPLWIDAFKKNKKNPGSLPFESESGIAGLYVPTEKFTKLDSGKYLNIKKKYPTLVNEITEYSFNQELIQKHLPIINKALSEISEIDDEDKKKLIIKTTSYSYMSKVFDNILSFTKNGNIVGLLEMLQPQYQLKNIIKTPANVITD